MDKNMNQTAFLRRFPETGSSFSGLKHLLEKMTAVASMTHVQIVVDHTLLTQLLVSNKSK